MFTIVLPRAAKTQSDWFFFSLAGKISSFSPFLSRKANKRYHVISTLDSTPPNRLLKIKIVMNLWQPLLLAICIYIFGFHKSYCLFSVPQYEIKILTIKTFSYSKTRTT